MLPPEEREYAVEPVGVEIRRPSAMEVVRGRLLRVRERCVRCGEEPRWRRSSFRACRGFGEVEVEFDDVLGRGGKEGGDAELEEAEGDIETRRRLRSMTLAGRVAPCDEPWLADQS